MDVFRLLTTFYITIAFGMANSKTVSDLCPESWGYHEHTGTCIRISSTSATFTYAKRHCESQRGGPYNDQPGWLISIKDEETDDYVKSLLDGYQKAYIGLFKQNNEYVWLEKSLVRNQYPGWSYGYPNNLSYYDYKYVVATINGWEDVYHPTTEYKFICQKYPTFSKPSFTCGYVEEDKLFPKLYCEYPIDNTVKNFERSTVSSTRFKESLFCDSNLLCQSSAYLSGNIYERRALGFFTTELLVNRQVTRSDDGQQWSCGYKFENIPEDLLMTRCKTKTYKLPEKVSCGHEFPRTGGINFVCEATGGYPKFSSAWNIGYQRLGKRQGVHQEIKKGGTLYYTSKFQWRFSKMLEGTHKLYVSMYPPTTFPNNEAKSKATITKTIQVTISIPKSPPRFSVKENIEIKQNVLTLTENQSVILICEINGGIPMVRQTFVRCDDTYVMDTSRKTSWSTAGHTVRIEIVATRAMNNKVCVCSGQHVTNQYKETASITLNVRHAAELISFEVNGRSQSSVQLYEKTRVMLSCSTHGNPKPTINIYKKDNSGKILRTLTNTSDTHVALSIPEVSCDTSGIYECAATNSLNSEISKREMRLRVVCPPKPCSQRYSDRQFKILPGTISTFRLCLFVYPALNSAVIVKPKDKPKLDSDAYSARFVYDDDLETKGYVIVNMSQSVAEVGDYTLQLYQSKWYNIDFSLMAYTKPSCPKSLNITHISSRFVVISWKPFSDHGIPQTFTLTTHNARGYAFNKQEIACDQQDVVSHNVTSLDPGSLYQFGLNVKNVQGITECPQLTVKVTTDSLPVTAGKTQSKRAGVIAGAVVFFALFCFCLFICMFLKIKRSKKQPKMPIWLRRGKKESQIFTEVREPKRASNPKRKSQHEPVGDIYSKVNKPKKKTVEPEDGVYSNKAAIELHSKQQPVGSRGDPVVGYFTQPSYDDQRRASHDFDWSDAGDSADDMDGDVTKSIGPPKIYDLEVNYRRQHLFRQTHTEYANSASIAETSEEDNAAISIDANCPPLYVRSETVMAPNGAKKPLRDVDNSKVEYSVVKKKNKPESCQGRNLVYIDVEVRPTKIRGDRNHSAANNLSSVDNVEEPVDYASLSYDADVSDSGTLGDTQL